MTLSSSKQTADVLVVGAGIAGWSAAFHAARAGREVLLVDAGEHRASDLPVALVNPLRGRDGRLVADGVAGMHATFDLIDTLRAEGHAIVGARGLHRPLIGITGAALRPDFWQARIGASLAFDWLDHVPSALGLADDVPTLTLRDAGWVGPRSLLRALGATRGTRCVTDRVTRVTGDGQGGGTAVLAGGATIVARSLIWCGGAWGAAQLDDDGAGDGPAAALYKPGSLVAFDGDRVREAMSFGLYAAPAAGLVDGLDAGVLVGPTREGSENRFPDFPVPPQAVADLGDRVARLFGEALAVRAVWRGVRLTRLSSSAGLALRGIPTITALGSRGFLMAPLLAARWARSL